jgi:hypothetical protein
VSYQPGPFGRQDLPRAESQPAWRAWVKHGPFWHNPVVGATEAEAWDRLLTWLAAHPGRSRTGMLVLRDGQHPNDRKPRYLPTPRAARTR